MIACLLASVTLFALEPNPPTWPDNVKILEPDDTGAQGVVDAIYHENGGRDPHDDHGQWSESRYAIFFKPGNHTLNVNVGYYTSIIGLGKTPKDTQISTVTCENGSFNYKNGALSNFWRSVENFYTKPSTTWNGKVSMLWAVSQAALMRRVFVDGNLCLYQYNPPGDHPAGYSSGGFMADCTVNGVIDSGSQQQWLTRNSYMGSWPGGNWNMVFVGCSNAPPSHCGHPKPFTTIKETPVIAEKPFVMFENDRYYLMVPKLERNKTGVTQDYDNVDQIDFHNVYVATDKDTASIINEKLEEGLHVVLSPGNYNLTESIQITKPNSYVLGIGFPTLISTKGSPCITVGNVDGVRIAGILLQAGPEPTPTLLEWGSKGYPGDNNNPGFLYDCFARVGGTNDPAVQQMQAETMVVINSGNVVGDNLWLWRADHGINDQKVYNSNNPCDTGIQINGDNVTMYGLAVEHTLKNMTEWNGENGRVYFYQSEYPYDVTQQNYGDPGYVSYKVADSVHSHNAWGIGVYSFFRDHPVTVNTGIETPTASCIHFTNSLSVFLDGQGQITHVINNTGDPVAGVNQQEYICEFPGS